MGRHQQDTSNEAAVNKLRKREKHQAQLLESAIQTVMGTESGRLVMAEACNLGNEGINTPFVAGLPDVSAYKEGVRSSCRDLEEMLRSFAPKGHRLMLTEELERRELTERLAKIVNEEAAKADDDDELTGERNG